MQRRNVGIPIGIVVVVAIVVGAVIVFGSTKDSNAAACARVAELDAGGAEIVGRLQAFVATAARGGQVWEVQTGPEALEAMKPILSDMSLAEVDCLASAKDKAAALRCI